MPGSTTGRVQRIRRALLGVTVAVAAVAVAACPIQRPPIPMDYFPFRDALRDSVAAVAYLELAERPELQDELQESIPELSTLTRPDTLVSRLAADPVLSSLAPPLESALGGVLDSSATSGGARKAFRRPEGQRLAVDAIVIGLGLALRRARVAR